MEGKYTSTPMLLQYLLLFKHETASILMFEYMIEDNDLMREFNSRKLGDEDVTFIKEQIEGPLEKSTENVV